LASIIVFLAMALPVGVQSAPPRLHLFNFWPARVEVRKPRWAGFRPDHFASTPVTPIGDA